MAAIIFIIIWIILLESVANSFANQQESNPFLAGIGLIFIGSLSGLVAARALPMRLFPMVNLHGVGILITAVLIGLFMMKYGKWREAKGHQPSYLATFWGGSLFAAMMALMRWMSVGN